MLDHEFQLLTCSWFLPGFVSKRKNICQSFQIVGGANPTPPADSSTPNRRCRSQLFFIHKFLHQLQFLHGHTHASWLHLRTHIKLGACELTYEKTFEPKKNWLDGCGPCGFLVGWVGPTSVGAWAELSESIWLSEALLPIRICALFGWMI